jgi:hypothetical protein
MNLKFFTTIQGLWVVFSSQKINPLSIYSPGFTQAQENNSKIVNFTKNLELNYIIHYRIHATALSEESAVDNLLRLLLLLVNEPREEHYALLRLPLVNEPREEHYALFPNLYLWSETTYVTSVLSRSNEYLLLPSLLLVRVMLNSKFSLMWNEFSGYWVTQLIFIQDITTNFSLFYNLERNKFVLLEFNSEAQITFKIFSSFYFVFNLEDSHGIGYISSEELVLATIVKISSYGWVSDQRPIPYDENSRGIALYFFLQYSTIL